MTRLEFGKHQGKLLHNVPTDYLEWVIATLHKISPLLRVAIVDELARRATSSPRPTRLFPVAVTTETALEIIEAGWRVLAKTAHPDVGGDAREMIALNATRDWLHQMLRDLDRDVA